MSAKKSRFPQQSECDMTDPEEHFLWALVQVAFSDRVTQPIQSNVARVISKQLHELGFRHHPQLQTKKLQMPHRGQQTLLNASAVWVPIDAEEAEPVVLPDVSTMTPHEQELMVEELRKLGRIKDNPVPQQKRARETSWRDRKSPHIKKASEVVPNGSDTGPERP